MPPVSEAFHQGEQVSRTLEYAYDDFALAQMAGALGEADDARQLRRRGGYWRNVWDPQVRDADTDFAGFPRPRSADGSWYQPADEHYSPRSHHGFHEGADEEQEGERVDQQHPDHGDQGGKHGQRGQLDRGRVDEQQQPGEDDRDRKEHDHRRKDGQGDEGEDQLPGRKVFTSVHHDAERPGVHVLGIQEDQRQQVAVPASDEGDDADSGDDGPRERQRDVPEKPDIAAAVDERRVEQFRRQVPEVVPEQQDAHPQPEGHLRQHHTPIGVEEPEVADPDEQRQDGRGRGKHQSDEKVVEESAGPEELHMREGEGRHRGKCQRQADGQCGDDQRVHHLPPVAVAEQDVGIVLELPFARQAERVGAQLAEGLEAAQRGRHQRYQHDRRHEDQRHVEVDAGADLDAAA